jgi:hypothetical protein
MLHNVKDLEGLAIHATDGDIGLTKDLYFDDKQWVIRYLVVETGSWFSSKKVLLSPMAIKSLNLEKKAITVAITRAQVRDSPDIDKHTPVSRQFEIDYASYYGYPLYWGGSGLWGMYPNPHMTASNYESGALDTFDDDDDDDDAMQYRDKDHHLRSINEVIGYHIEASDGEIGHLQGMLIDLETLAIRYLIINTQNWWVGNLVLIAPQWIKEVYWPTQKISVDMTQQQVKDAPFFDLEGTHNREQEKEIYLHYGRKGYWEFEPIQSEAKL